MTAPDAPSQPICLLGVSERTLSALRDHALDRAEVARLSAHITECPVCRDRISSFNDIAAALRAERPPEPDERLWRGFVTMAPSSGHAYRARFAGVALSRRSWNRFGAVAAVLLLTLGFLMVSSFQRSGVSVRLTPTATLGPTATTTPSPTATPRTLPARPLSWQPAATGAPGDVTTMADDGDSAYSCAVSVGPQGNAVMNIWRTIDRGGHWLWASDVPAVPTANGCELVVDGSDPSVAALAWAPRGGGGGDSYTGLMTTVDGGTTWQAQPTQPFSRIDQLDSRDGVIYALRETADSAGSVEYHLWASSDRMRSWRQLDAGQSLSSAVAGFWLQPDGQSILAIVSVGGDGIQAQLYYSPDSGATWNHLSVPGGLPLGYVSARFVSLGELGTPNGVVARAIQGRFHICVSLSPPNAPTGISNPPVVTCSTDTGATWLTRTTSVLTNAEGVPVGPTLVGIADDGDLLISALDALYRLSAASNAWQSLGTPPHAYLTYCSAPGSGLLWAVPSGQTGTGQQNVVYTASYAP